jgi:hypothetical protein
MVGSRQTTCACADESSASRVSSSTAAHCSWAKAARRGDNGFIEVYTTPVQGTHTSVVVTVTRNAAGKTQHVVVNHRPRSSLLLFAPLMGQKFAGPPIAKYLITSEP